jgi:hypothetical protein
MMEQQDVQHNVVLDEWMRGLMVLMQHRHEHYASQTVEHLLVQALMD